MSAPLLVCFLALAACRPPPPSAETNHQLPVPHLQLLGDVNLDPHAGGSGSVVGGLSDLCFDAKRGVLLALSDDRAEHGPARFYELAPTLGGDSLSVVITRSIELRGETGPFERDSIDPEGIALAPGGGLLVSTEGDASSEPRRPPMLLLADTAGGFRRRIEVPARFIPNPRGAQVSGVRDNEGFEGLTTTPSGRWVFVANEQALMADGPRAGAASGTLIRIVRYDEHLVATAEHAYLTDSLAGTRADPDVSVVGVAALMALDDRRLWVLERAGIAREGHFVNRVRIYQVDIAEAADVSHKTSLVAADALPKTLVFDMDEVASALHPPKLDNYEGMSFGPVTANGQRSVILVSDDNFKPSQRTSMVAFALDE